MPVHPQLFLDGRCDEAIEFYRAVLGAEQVMLPRRKDSPEPVPVPPAAPISLAPAARITAFSNQSDTRGG